MTKILFDLDETLYIGDIVKIACDQLVKEGKIPPGKLSGSDVNDFAFSNFPPIIRDRIFELFKDPIIAAIDKTPVKGSYSLIYYLKYVKNWEIGILTARPQQLHEVTRFCLWRDFPNITWDFFGFANNTKGHDSAVSKRKLLDIWKPDYYFDDYLEFCREAEYAGVPYVYLIKNKHTGWNQSTDKSVYINIKQIKSIVEFDVINGI